MYIKKEGYPVTELSETTKRNKFRRGENIIEGRKGKRSPAGYK